MALIELRGVTKSYRVGDQQIAALDGVDLDIGSGEFAAIIGPSGSGKSTLMHLLGCLDTPSSGTVTIDGTDVSRAGDGALADMRNRKIGFVFQSFNLLPKFNVLQNVELPMVYANVSPKERRARALAAIERVAIARALVNDPRIIFADEPTGNLDSATGDSILALFRELCDAGRTIVLVTHDPAIARRTRRQIEIRDGKIVRDTATP
jgi:putative ABC transport system ATP-binding protein